MKPFTQRLGFTLIELLLVIGIIAILASIVIVAINPTKQLADARDAQRRNDVRVIMDAVYQYTIDQGQLPASFPNGVDNALEICRTGQPDCTGYISLSMLSGTYLVDIPEDPQLPNGEVGTYYAAYSDSNNRITIFSLNPEEESTISVTR